MKATYRSILATLAMSLLIAAIASGCTGAAGVSPAAPQATSAASTPQTSRPGIVAAKAEVVPAHTSEMGFVIEARVKELNVKEGDQVKAGQALIVLDTPNLQNDLVAAQAEVDSAQKNNFLQRSTRQYKVWNGRHWIWTHGIQELRVIADARVEQALGALEVAQVNLAQGTLVAPFDGTVVSVSVEPGEMVQPQETVLILGDLEHLQVQTTDLSEREIAQLKIGQKATVRLKAFDQELTGKVVAIAPKAEESEGDMVFKVTIELEKPPKGLLWGMTGDVEIDIAD